MYGGKLGGLQLLRPSRRGVVAYVARGTRGLGRRESAYSGFDLGRGQMISYDGAEASGSALPIVERLKSVVRRGGAIGSPGTLRGKGMSVEGMVACEEEKRWLRARACEQTVTGVIYVHEESMWVRQR